MPRLRTILALSLGGNVLLAIMVVSAWRSATHQVAIPSASTAMSPPAASVSLPQWSELYSPDRAQFRKNLEAAGLPFATIADILRAQRKIRTLKEKESQSDTSVGFSLKNFWDIIPAASQGTYSTQQYLGFLTGENRAAAEKILKDYAEMERELLQAFIKQGNAAAGADFLAKRIGLDREKQRDLTAILGSQGMELFDLWNSPLAHSLRKDLNGFNPTEAEFRLIYQAARNYESETSGLSGPDMFKQQLIADQAKLERLRAVLGEERYHDYVRTESTEYHDLVAIGERFQLPVSTANRLFDLRSAMARESWRIASETTVPVDGRIEQLKALAGRTEAQFLKEAGSEAGPQLQGLVSEWTKPLREGTAVLYERKSSSYFPLKPSSGASSK